MTLRRTIEQSYEINPSNQVVKRVWKEATDISTHRPYEYQMFNSSF
jgi:hypothetical protein